MRWLVALFALCLTGLSPHASPAEDDLLDKPFRHLFVPLEEFDSVRAQLGTQLPKWLQEPENIKALTEVKRGFHTLKGSGRMVGLDRLGEAAWTVEQSLNWWLRSRTESTP